MPKLNSFVEKKNLLSSLNYPLYLTNPKQMKFKFVEYKGFKRGVDPKDKFLFIRPISNQQQQIAFCILPISEIKKIGSVLSNVIKYLNPNNTILYISVGTTIVTILISWIVEKKYTDNMWRESVWVYDSWMPTSDEDFDDAKIPYQIKENRKHLEKTYNLRKLVRRNKTFLISYTFFFEFIRFSSIPYISISLICLSLLEQFYRSKKDIRTRIIILEESSTDIMTNITQEDQELLSIYGAQIKPIQKVEEVIGGKEIKTLDPDNIIGSKTKRFLMKQRVRLQKIENKIKTLKLLTLIWLGGIGIHQSIVLMKNQRYFNSSLDALATRPIIYLAEAKNNLKQHAEIKGDLNCVSLKNKSILPKNRSFKSTIKKELDLSNSFKEKKYDLSLLKDKTELLSEKNTEKVLFSEKNKIMSISLVDNSSSSMSLSLTNDEIQALSLSPAKKDGLVFNKNQEDLSTLECQENSLIPEIEEEKEIEPKGPRRFIFRSKERPKPRFFARFF